MYVPGFSITTMATDSVNSFDGGIKPEVDSTTSTSIYVTWQVEDLVGPFIHAFQVHYQKVASSYVQYSNLLEATDNGYNIQNLVADTYYKVCVVMYRNDTSHEVRQCVDANTNTWHIPVSIGSSIGAVLALSIIVFIVLLSRCPSLIHSQRQVTSDSSKYDSMSSHFPDDHHEFSETTTQCAAAAAAAAAGHEANSDSFCEHHTHNDDTITSDSMSPLTEHVKHGRATMCNGNRNIVTQHGHRTYSDRTSGHVHRPRPYHHSLILERSHPARLLHTNSLDERQPPVLLHTTSLDEPIGLKDYPV